MIEKPGKFAHKNFNFNDLHNFDTMTAFSTFAWYRPPIMASLRDHTIKNAMKKYCLTVPIVARPCQTK